MICKSCYKRLEAIQKKSKDLANAKDEIRSQVNSGRLFFVDSGNKRSRIPVSPRMCASSPVKSPSPKRMFKDRANLQIQPHGRACMCSKY